MWKLIASKEKKKILNIAKKKKNRKRINWPLIKQNRNGSVNA